MAVKVEKKNLQDNIYRYTWSRDQGDAPYKGTSDRVKVDKDEGYEVVYFIEKFMNKHNLDHIDDAHAIENALHMPELSKMVYRDDLIKAIEKKLGYS
ncbi:hypothetical protein [Acinetobacter guillouiae]|jgi:uncharacterized protein YqfB (UPF0267 family)|uniref:hypothetical protein n=1 Tax=Acinetobacter guillouiae TaxID=106649 RepID=UPI0028D7E47D|nr:hypothetical protein [Acinetobacter guillouiae]